MELLAEERKRKGRRWGGGHFKTFLSTASWRTQSPRHHTNNMRSPLRAGIELAVDGRPTKDCRVITFPMQARSPLLLPPWPVRGRVKSRRWENEVKATHAACTDKLGFPSLSLPAPTPPLVGTAESFSRPWHSPITRIRGAWPCSLASAARGGRRHPCGSTGQWATESIPIPRSCVACLRCLLVLVAFCVGRGLHYGAALRTYSLVARVSHRYEAERAQGA